MTSGMRSDFDSTGNSAAKSIQGCEQGSVDLKHVFFSRHSVYGALHPRDYCFYVLRYTFWMDFNVGARFLPLFWGKSMHIWYRRVTDKSWHTNINTATLSATRNKDCITIGEHFFLLFFCTGYIVWEFMGNRWQYWIVWTSCVPSLPLQRTTGIDSILYEKSLIKPR